MAAAFFVRRATMAAICLAWLASSLSVADESLCPASDGLSKHLPEGPGMCPGARGLESTIFGSSVPAMPPVTAVDDVLDVSRGHTRTNANGQEVTYDEATTLNAIALGHRSGIPLTASDVASRSNTGSVGAIWFNFLIPHAETIRNILALGVQPVAATGFDVSYAGFMNADGATSGTRTLPDETTDAALVLMGAGVAVDPHDLISTTDDVQHRSRVQTFPPPSIPPAGADLAGQAAIASIRGNSVPYVFAFSQRDIRHDETLDRSRDVALKDENAFAAAALVNNGIAFALEDALDVRETSRYTVDEIHERSVERQVLLYWLTLGLRFV